MFSGLCQICKYCIVYFGFSAVLVFSLRQFRFLDGNEFSGRIPDSLSCLRNLTALFVSFC